MGTRAITNVVNDKGEVYVSLYRQFDGYPKGGHGEDLAEWLEGAVIGNGINEGESRPKFFNGLGDLAARLVTFFKEDDAVPGGFYLIPFGSDWDGEFTYTISGADPTSFDTLEYNPQISVDHYGDLLFEGSVEEFKSWVFISEDDD